MLIISFFFFSLPRDLIDIIDPVKEWAFGFADFLYQFFSFQFHWFVL